MNPVLACPQCGKPTDFHEDEVEGVEDGLVICLGCGLELAHANMVMEIVAGQHPELVDQIMGDDEDEQEEEEDDD